MFNHKPNQEEIARWFAGQSLHKGMLHENYVSGIVVIENEDKRAKTSVWTPYINATARIAYFWDWLETRGYTGDILASDPELLTLSMPDGTAHAAMYITATVTACKPTDTDGRTISTLIRQATGRKQVGHAIIRRGWQGKPDTFFADQHAVMKAETGAIARALGSLGMLALPSSGIATAEDMFDLMREREPVQEPAKVERKTRAAPNPKG